MGVIVCIQYHSMRLYWFSPFVVGVCCFFVARQIHKSFLSSEKKRVEQRSHGKSIRLISLSFCCISWNFSFIFIAIFLHLTFLLQKIFRSDLDLCLKIEKWLPSMSPLGNSIREPMYVHFILISVPYWKMQFCVCCDFKHKLHFRIDINESHVICSYTYKSYLLYFIYI